MIKITQNSTKLDLRNWKQKIFDFCRGEEKGQLGFIAFLVGKRRSFYSSPSLHSVFTSHLHILLSKHDLDTSWTLANIQSANIFQLFSGPQSKHVWIKALCFSNKSQREHPIGAEICQLCPPSQHGTQNVSEIQHSGLLFYLTHISPTVYSLLSLSRHSSY